MALFTTLLNNICVFYGNNCVSDSRPYDHHTLSIGRQFSNGLKSNDGKRTDKQRERERGNDRMNGMENEWMILVIWMHLSCCNAFGCSLLQFTMLAVFMSTISGLSFVLGFIGANHFNVSHQWNIAKLITFEKWIFFVVIVVFFASLVFSVLPAGVCQYVIVVRAEFSPSKWKRRPNKPENEKHTQQMWASNSSAQKASLRIL